MSFIDIINLKAGNKGDDPTVRMRRLIFTPIFHPLA